MKNYHKKRQKEFTKNTGGSFGGCCDYNFKLKFST